MKFTTLRLYNNWVKSSAHTIAQLKMIQGRERGSKTGLEHEYVLWTMPRCFESTVSSFEFGYSLIECFHLRWISIYHRLRPMLGVMDQSCFLDLDHALLWSDRLHVIVVLTVRATLRDRCLWSLLLDWCLAPDACSLFDTSQSTWVRLSSMLGSRVTFLDHPVDIFV